MAILKEELERSQGESVKNLRAFEGSIDSNKKIIAQMEQLTTENGVLKDRLEKLEKTNNANEMTVKVKMSC